MKMSLVCWLMTQTVFFSYDELLKMGRCTTCGCHPPTQGHKPGCTSRPGAQQDIDEAQYDPTDEQRREVRKAVEEIERGHLMYDDKDKKFSRRDSSEQRRQALLGEMVLHNRYGCHVDLSFHRGGDREDTLLPLRNGKDMAADVKVSTYNGFDPKIRVPEDQSWRPGVIYIGGYYVSHLDTVRLRCWDLGHRFTEHQVFPGQKVMNRVRSYTDCRPMSELDAMVVKRP
jgi:hypothetical protein